MLPVFLILYLGFLGFSKGAGILPDGPLDAAIGGSVLFETTKTPPETPFSLVTWTFGLTNIGISTPSTENIAADYQGRARIFHSNGSLELSRLTAADSGEYGVTIYPGTGDEESGNITLRVHAPVSNVTIDPETLDLVEFNDSLKLSCSSSGSLLSFIWIKDGSAITASDRVQITDEGKILTIVNVTRDDQGNYTCEVSNPVSNTTSDPATVTVNYGPESTKLTQSPAGTNHAVGSDITMSCSAESRPPAQFTWFLNGSQLLDTGSELRLMDVDENRSGSYSCQAFNTKTLRFQTSEPAVINVLNEILDASVKPTNPPVEGTSFNLTCEASGLVESRGWMKDGSDLTLTDNMKLYDNNRVLSFTTVTRNDNGEYVCNISNSFSSMEAAFSLTVNYGPEKVEISGENQIKVGSTIELSCTADSVPLAEFTWLLNETQILNSSSQFIKNISNVSDSGTYTCRATNEITGKSSSAEHRLSVTATLPVDPSGCSAGCIAGIVVACVVVIAALLGVGYCFFQRRGKTKKSVSTTAGGRVQESTGNRSEDLNYADIRFYRNNQGVSVPLGAQNTTTDYAEVQVNSKGPAASSPPSYDAHVQRTKRLAPQPGANGAPTNA